MTPIAIVLLAALASASSLEADYPAANVERSPAGVSQVSGLSVSVPAGQDPAAAAEAFIRRYAPDFGVRDEKLVPSGPPVGGRVRFTRSVNGIAVANADIVVAFDSTGNIILVNLGQIPGPASGRFALTAKQARARARASFRSATDVPGAEPLKVWYPSGRTTRPAWRVDVATTKPHSSWRVYVDGQNGKILFKQDLRITGLK